MKYQKISLLKKQGHSFKACCHFAQVSCSGFYKWENQSPSKRENRDKELKSKITQLFKTSKRTYGSPRIQKQLEREGQKVGKNRVARLMREEHLVVNQKKSFRPKTTLNSPKEKKSPREFKIESQEISRMNEIWVSDLTYIPTEKGFVI